VERGNGCRPNLAGMGKGSQHFGTDPKYIRIRINPKIRIPNRDHFQLKFWSRRRFALSECFCLLMSFVIFDVEIALIFTSAVISGQQHEQYYLYIHLYSPQR